MKYLTFEAIVQNAWNTTVKGINILVVTRKRATSRERKKHYSFWNRETDSNVISKEMLTLYALRKTIHSNKICLLIL